MRGKTPTPNAQRPTRKAQLLLRSLASVFLAVAVGSWAFGGWELTGAQSPQEPADAPVTFRIIVVSSEDRAGQVAERLRQGANFATLAQTESLDPSASQGGLIGPIALSELRAELRDALRDLPQG